jgi:long-chain acyl-CoA synthetase
VGDGTTAAGETAGTLRGIDDVHAEMAAPGSPFETAEETVRGIRMRVWRHAPGTLRDVLATSAGFGDRTFLVYFDERISHAEHADRAARLAAVLAGRYGVRKGDRVALAMRNLPEWSIAFFAAGALGAIVVPLNAWWSADELAFGLDDSGAKLLVADGERAGRLAGVVARTGLPTIVARPGDALPPGARTFDDVLAEAPPGTPLPDADLHPDDDATIFYTSGTTGTPKGALGTHRNLCGNIVAARYGRVRSLLRAGTRLADLPSAPPVALLAVPLFHATGCHSILATTINSGGTLVLMYKWDPEVALELIERERVTTFTGVPSMTRQLTMSPDIASRDVSSLAALGSGGAPATADLLRRYRDSAPGAVPGNGYGLTETSSVSTYIGGADYRERPASIGMPVAVVDVLVADPSGAPVPTGEIGELLIKGPNIVRGYWNRPGATAAAITDGWLHSGDLARLDADGFVYIVDRAKDMIIRGGENVYCAEVESRLHEHPDVVEAAVIGVPSDDLGEEVGAVLRLVPGARLDAADLREWLAPRMAAFKIPTHVQLTDRDLPRNPGGKILKNRLRDRFA